MATSRPNLFERTMVLAVSGNHEELEQLQRLFTESSWMLQALGTLADAKRWLGQNPAPVVLCASQLPDGDWKDMLQVTAQIDPSPNLVVASRLADNRLWAEVLNLGGYDVLPLPTNAAEMFRTLSGAWRNWKARSDVEAIGLSPPELDRTALTGPR
jgi:DNA-binding NtrC family response regulator